MGNNGQYRRFCTVIGRDDLAADPDFATNLGRSRHRDRLAPEIDRELARIPRGTLIAALQKAGIPCGEVAGLHEAVRSDRTAQARMLSEERVPTFAPPYRLDGTRPPVRLPPPGLGEHTTALLAELGLDSQHIADLRSRGIVAG